MRRTLAVAVLVSAALTTAGASAATVGPYLELTSSESADMATELPAAGLHAVTLAFIVTGKRACVPRWDGGADVAAKPFASPIAALRAAGVEPTLSFGGQGGRELGLSCRTARALATAYGRTASAYKITSLDFDLEGPGLARGALVRRAQALRMLQRANPKLRISLTLPVATYGLLPNALAAIRSLLAQRVRVDSVNIMTMDFGDDDAPAPAGRMGDYSIGAANAVHAQLGRLGHGLGSWQALAVTPMIGINDVASEVFTLADASSLAGFASSTGLGQLHYWVFNRDRQCAEPSAETQNDCSGVEQAPGAFAAALSARS